MWAVAVPAEAGTHANRLFLRQKWILAFAGKTPQHAR
jgi:hypothetical protein